MSLEAGGWWEWAGGSGWRFGIAEWGTGAEAGDGGWVGLRVALNVVFVGLHSVLVLERNATVSASTLDIT